MRITAKTLVHDASHAIGLHAVRTFAECYAGGASLEIHTDGSLSKSEQDDLIAAAGQMNAVIICPEERRSVWERRLASFPLTKSLLERGGYMVKMELPLSDDRPFFYFDSDIVWLRPSTGILPEHSTNAFSTESWSWYYGIRKPNVWIRERVPRRVNSGFYYLGETFPCDRMERILSEGLYDPDAESATDQELMAFLYTDAEMYHPEDFVRSRRGITYDLSTISASAIHFPGRMWESHIEQIRRLSPQTDAVSKMIRKERAVPLNYLEIARMKYYRSLESASWSRLPLRAYRATRKIFR
jgi:hypothetical protein